MKVYKRGEYYYLRAMVNRQRVHRCLYETDPRKARRKAEALVREIREAKPPVPTVAEWWETYERVYTSAKGEEAQRKDRRIFKRLVESWGSLRLNEIKQSHCRQWKLERSQVLAQNTLRIELAIISAFFRAAVLDKVIEANPWDEVPRPEIVPRTRVLGWDEQEKLMRQLKPKYQVAVKIILGTGLREHELIKLKPEDVKADGLHVLGKGRKKRVIPLQKEVRELIPRLERLNDRAFLEAVQRACARAKIPAVTIHDLRRTFATRCAVAGMPMPVLQRILGHSPKSTATAQYYVHVQTNELQAAIDRVDLGLTEAARGKVLAFEKA